MNDDDIHLELRAGSSSCCEVKYYAPSGGFAKKTVEVDLKYDKGIESAYAIIPMGYAQNAENWYAKEGTVRLYTKTTGNNNIGNIKYLFKYGHDQPAVNSPTVSFPVGISISFGTGTSEMASISKTIYR